MANSEQLKSIQLLEERIDALESRNAFQDDIIEQLNSEVAIHQRVVSELSDQIKMISSRLKEMRQSDGLKPEDEPPPPHY